MSVADRKEREKQQRRSEILAVAEKQFFAKGYSGVSMDEIARELELSKPTIYLYFKNKDSLFLTVCMRAMEILSGMFAKGIAGEPTGLGQAKAAARAFFDYADHYPDHYRLLNEMRSPYFMGILKSGNIESLSDFSASSLVVITMLFDAIRRGTEDGTIRKGVDPEQTAIFLATAMEGAVNVSYEYRWLMDRRGTTIEQYREHCLNLILFGIAGNPDIGK